MKNTIWLTNRDEKKRRVTHFILFNEYGKVTGGSRLAQNLIGKRIGWLIDTYLKGGYEMYCDPIRIDNTKFYPYAEMIKENREESPVGLSIHLGKVTKRDIEKAKEAFRKHRAREQKNFKRTKPKRKRGQ